MGKSASGVYLALLLLGDIRKKGGKVSYDELMKDYKKEHCSNKNESELNEKIFIELINRLIAHNLVQVNDNIINIIK